MVTVGLARRAAVYTANYDYTPPNALPIRAGMKFWVMGLLGPDGWVVKNDDYNVSHNLVVDSAGYPMGWYPRTGAPVDVGRLDKPLFTRSEEVLDDAKAFRAELIYSGVSGSTLNAMYREYVNDMARPAFAQQLTYEISKGKDIAFKTLRIEVVNATNSQVEFRVLSDGGLPWVGLR